MAGGYARAVSRFLAITVALPRAVEAQLGIPSPDSAAVRALGDPRQQHEGVPVLLAAASFPLLNRVAVPTWPGVADAQRRDFEAFAAGAERLFSVFWSWLIPAHELAHLFAWRAAA